MLSVNKKNDVYKVSKCKIALNRYYDNKKRVQADSITTLAI